MDASYLRFARSIVDLGEAIEGLCRVAPTSNPKVEPLRMRAHQLMQFGTTLTNSPPSKEPSVEFVAELATAADQLASARNEILQPKTIDPYRLRTVVASVNAALSGVLPGFPDLPGLPDLPDLPKPDPVPVDDIVELATSARED